MTDLHAHTIAAIGTIPVTPELRRAVDVVRIHAAEYRQAVRADARDDHRHGYRLREARNLALGSLLNAKAALADLVMAALERSGA